MDLVEKVKSTEAKIGIIGLGYDYTWLYSKAKLIIDTRNAMGGFQLDDKEKVVKA